MRKYLIATLVAVATLTVTPAAARHSYSHPASDYGDSYYTNVSGHRVHRPVAASSRPVGATAHCRDGSWSFSENHRGTCSHHGGVGSWL